MIRARHLAHATVVFFATGCGGKKSIPSLPQTTFAYVAMSKTDLLTGADARGRLGDLVLSNDRVKLVFQQIEDPTAWSPYGATLVDASVRISEAWSDDAQQLNFDQFKIFVDEIKPFLKAAGRRDSGFNV